jgi:DNA polymerase-1
VTTVYETLERPLVPVLARMETRASRWIAIRSARMSNAFAQKMAGLEAEIHELAGESFNVGSPKQLGEILFDKMGLDRRQARQDRGLCDRGGCAGGPRAEGHLLPARVLDWRQLSKLKSTYTDALQDHIDPDTGRVHTSYSIAGANTGRLASTDPNLQNIPSAPRRAAASARPSSPIRARCWSRSTIPRSSCASSPISPASRR